MKKWILTLLIISLSSALPSTAFASDRSSEVYGRIQSSLAGFLDREAFVVIVKKGEDFAGAATAQKAVGVATDLPGLQVAVDTEGNLIQKNDDVNSYKGPVDITVLIDQTIHEDTYKTIEDLLPEIIGTENVADSISISRALLKQVVPASQPEIVIQNGVPQDQSSSPSSMKFLAILLFGAGILLWIFGRKSDNNNTSPSERAASYAPPSPAQQESADIATKTLSQFYSHEVLAYYLLKHSGNEEKCSAFVNLLSLGEQKETVQQFPIWLAQHFTGVWNQNSDESSGFEDELSIEIVNRELALLDREISSDNAKQEFFIQNFPWKALDAAYKDQKTLSNNALMSLWQYRPEASRLFGQSQGLNVEVLTSETDGNVPELFKELWNLDSQVSAKQKSQRDPVQVWSSVINQMESFTQVNEQLLNAQKKLAPEQYSSLEDQVVTEESIFKLSEKETKEWLRIVEPADLVWFLSTLSKQPSWDFESLVRPMRLAMIKGSQQEQVHTDWDSSNIEHASSRILGSLRLVLPNEATASTSKDPILRVA